MYPIGIPALYAAILWKQRELLNPRIHAATQSGPGIAGGAAATTDCKKGAGIHISMFSSTSKDQAKDTLSRQDLQEYHHRVRDRREHPELAPSMFLWKDFGEVSNVGVHVIPGTGYLFEGLVVYDLFNKR